MKIAILGAGRMGSLVAGFATRGGADCYLIDTWKEHVDAINQDGLTIYNNEDPPFNVKCKAFTSADQIGEKWISSSSSSWVLSPSRLFQPQCVSPTNTPTA